MGAAEQADEVVFAIDREVQYGLELGLPVRCVRVSLAGFAGSVLFVRCDCEVLVHPEDWSAAWRRGALTRLEAAVRPGGALEVLGVPVVLDEERSER